MLACCTINGVTRPSKKIYCGAGASPDSWDISVAVVCNYRDIMHLESFSAPFYAIIKNMPLSISTVVRCACELVMMNEQSRRKQLVNSCR
jgi:hypothetical protein